MDILYERVAGLDVHRDTIVACMRIMVDGKEQRECRTFAATTEQLVELRRWLEESRCTHVAMEATGVYWMPVFRILGEGAFELIVANAAHIKNVPGRKTDMNDAMWIADLLACGLIKGSFIPEEKVQELRALTRTRKQLVREQTRHVQRIDKTLAEANIKLGSVISDIMGARRPAAEQVGRVCGQADQGVAEGALRCVARAPDGSPSLSAHASPEATGWSG
jgi:transposase